MKAVGSRNVETVKMLLEARADVSMKTMSGLTPLDIAESIRDTEMVNILSRTTKSQAV